MKSLVISNDGRVLRGEVNLPGSKSISNRVLMIRALAGKDFPVGNLSSAADTVLMEQLLRTVKTAGRRDTPVLLDAMNAGTVFRFLTAFLSITPGKWLLTGSARMLERPIGPLVEALRSLGAEIAYIGRPGFPPIQVDGRMLKGGEVRIEAGISSQFISALLLIAPLLPGGLTVHLSGEEVSAPYTLLTMELLRKYGISVRRSTESIMVSQGEYKCLPFMIESDWSAASFWYEAAALSPSPDIRLQGLMEGSLQGDSLVSEIFGYLGVGTRFTAGGVRLIKKKKRVSEFYFDFTRQPDLAPPVIAACAALGIRARFEGLESLRIKESDRAEAIVAELGRLGSVISLFRVNDRETVIELYPSTLNSRKTGAIRTYGDHRLAMAMAPLCMSAGPLRIGDPDVVSKSYPGYWKEMELAGYRIGYRD